MDRTLVLGAGGMLGQAFVRLLGGNALTASRGDLDITNITAIEQLVSDSGAQLVVNCAAHTNVDAAEADPGPAFAVNALLPGIVGIACRRAGLPIVHLSSTGCYGAWQDDAYTEEDAPRPTTAHHRSKLSGEVVVRDSGAEHLIVRTGWLFGGAADSPKNFVWKRMVEAAGSSRMTSDATQRGNPTFVDDLARQVIHAAAAGCRGTVNAVAHGGASRYEYVRRVVEAAGLPCVVEPSTTPFRRPAPVSPNEVAVNERLGLLGLDNMPHWADALDAYVAELKRSLEWTELRKHA
jgi:dTDP-4-dehydrorhamnose reductase